MTKNLTKEQKKIVERQAKIALAKKDFYFFCNLMFPNIFKKQRKHLKLWAGELKEFINDDKTFFILNGPPRHGKSLIGQCLCAWLFGNNPALRILVLAYNMDTAEIYGKRVKALINREKISDDEITYSDIFPETKIKYGDNAAAKWSINGNAQVSFLSASLSSTITSMGFDICIVDDMIKNSEEARNAKQLEKDYEIFKDTVFSRMEGDKCKFIITMTRWATGDICGRMINEEGFKNDTKLIITKAKDENGNWIAPDMMFKDGKFTENISTDIFLANYQQEPIDVQDRMYEGFKTYNNNMLPEKDEKGRKYVYMTECVIDTADRGKDFYCAIWYIPWRGKIFIKDILYTQNQMAKMESEIVDKIIQNQTRNIIAEGNNGGSIHLENLKKEYKRRGENSCRFSFFMQNLNKESRIIAQSKWVEDNIYFPQDWDKKFTKFYSDLSTFQREFKSNKHDDAADTITMIADKYNGKLKKGIKII